MIAKYVIDFLFEANDINSTIPLEIKNIIRQSDPTTNEKSQGKYTQWMFRLYSKLDNNEKERMIEDLYKIKDALSIFSKNYSKLDKKSIDQYKTYHELINAVDKFDNDISNTNLKKEEIKDIKLNQTDKVYEDSEWLIVSPKTIKSSQFWGQGTKWCTAAEDMHNRFEHYTKNGPIYYFINKRLKDNKKRQLKYAMQFDRAEFRNAIDDTISTNEIELNNNIKELFIDIIKSDEKNFISLANWALIFPEDKDKMLNIMLTAKDPSDYATHWFRTFEEDKDIMRELIKKYRTPKNAITWYNTGIIELEEHMNKDDYNMVKDIIINGDDDLTLARFYEKYGNVSEVKSHNSNIRKRLLKTSEGIIILIRSHSKFTPEEIDIAKKLAVDTNDVFLMHSLNHITRDNDIISDNDYLNALLKSDDSNDLLMMYLSKHTEYIDVIAHKVLEQKSYEYVYIILISYKSKLNENLKNKLMDFILNGKSSIAYALSLAYSYPEYREELKNLVLKQGQFHIAIEWASEIGDKEEMKQLAKTPAEKYEWKLIFND